MGKASEIKARYGEKVGEDITIHSGGGGGYTLPFVAYVSAL